MNALYLRDLGGQDPARPAGACRGWPVRGWQCLRVCGGAGDGCGGEPGSRRPQDHPGGSAGRGADLRDVRQRPQPDRHRQGLERRRHPWPEGRTWRDTTIRGHAGRATGILRNELYVGRLVWNRMTFVKDPGTGKRVSRMNPTEQRIRRGCPGTPDRWAGSLGPRSDQARCDPEASGADRPDRARFWEKRRAQHLLTGKVFCGCCGGTMTNIGRDYLACATARRQGLCANRHGIRRERLESLILDALRERLMQPEHVAVFVRSSPPSGTGCRPSIGQQGRQRTRTSGRPAQAWRADRCDCRWAAGSWATGTAG